MPAIVLPVAKLVSFGIASLKLANAFAQGPGAWNNIQSLR
jgi:hypothetical protein